MLCLSQAAVSPEYDFQVPDNSYRPLWGLFELLSYTEKRPILSQPITKVGFKVSA